MAKQQNSLDKKFEWRQVWHVFDEIGKWIYRLRSILLAIPVIVAAIVLASYNIVNLPEYVGLNLRADGEYATIITRGMAVLSPLALTSVCLLMMFCSKKILYPWLISLFSLILPLIFLFTSTFP